MNNLVEHRNLNYKLIPYTNPYTNKKYLLPKFKNATKPYRMFETFLLYHVALNPFAYPLDDLEPIVDEVLNKNRKRVILDSPLCGLDVQYPTTEIFDIYNEAEHPELAFQPVYIPTTLLKSLIIQYKMSV